jgi:hypothetical protein
LSLLTARNIHNAVCSRIAITAFIFVATLPVLIGYASSALVIDEKYHFPEFEQVDSISRLNLQGWETIDSQSLIVQIDPSQYYLLILRNPMPDLNFAETILFTATGNRIEAGIDCVEVVGPGCAPEAMPVVIETIYKLDGQDAVDRARTQILGG